MRVAENLLPSRRGGPVRQWAAAIMGANYEEGWLRDQD
jgi:hypothetical protein